MKKSEFITFDDLYPQPGDHLLYYGPDYPNMMTCGKEYYVINCRHFASDGTVLVVGDDGFTFRSKLSNFLLKEDILKYLLY